MGDSYIPSGLRLSPDLLASRSLTIRLETKNAKLVDDFAIGKSEQTTHYETAAGDEKFFIRALFGTEDRWKEVAMFKARFHNFARETLRNLHCFGHRTSFSDKAGNVRTGAENSVLFSLFPRAHGLRLLPLRRDALGVSGFTACFQSIRIVFGSARFN